MVAQGWIEPFVYDYRMDNGLAAVHSRRLHDGPAMHAEHCPRLAHGEVFVGPTFKHEGEQRTAYLAPALRTPRDVLQYGCSPQQYVLGGVVTPAFMDEHFPHHLAALRSRYGGMIGDAFYFEQDFRQSSGFRLRETARGLEMKIQDLLSIHYQGEHPRTIFVSDHRMLYYLFNMAKKSGLVYFELPRNYRV